MAIEIRLPQFGMGMQEGIVTRWHKRPGEQVEAGDLIAEIEAAKVVEELYAPGSGVIELVLVTDGTTVPINELLAIIREPGETAVIEPPGAIPPSNDPISQQAPKETSNSRQTPQDIPSAHGISPRARRLANELSVDLSILVGTGPEGRITEDDVRLAAEIISSESE